MTFETFFDKFDQFADAPNVVAKLREFVLSLAVQGKLVEQDSNDEPASKLLQQLINFKSQNPLSGRSGRTGEVAIGPNREIKDDVPAKWVNTTIGEVLHVIRGASPRPKGDPQYFSEIRTPYHWVKISDIRKHGQNGFLMDTDEFLTEAGMRKSVLLPKGTLVLTNSATIGIPIVLGIEGCCIHDGYLAFPNFPYQLLSQKFLLCVFHTLKKYAEQNARGLAQLNLNTDLVRSFPLRLPPLAEQRRIVAKVDELMALCDRLEAQLQARETQQAALARAALARFADAPTPANLELLFHPAFAVAPADLRKSILTLAVQGKLVVNNPSEEPVALKVSDNLLNPLSFPKNWRTGLIGDIYIFEYGDSLPAPKRIETGEYPVYGSNGIVGTHDKYLTKEPAIIIGRKGSAGALNIANGPSWTTDVAYFVQPPKEIDLRFTYYLFSSLQFDNLSKGIKPGLNRNEVYAISIPLPPFAEQRRIVAKVDELMALVDQLEAQLATARTRASQLLDAMIAELTAS